MTLLASIALTLIGVLVIGALTCVLIGAIRVAYDWREQRLREKQYADQWVATHRALSQRDRDEITDASRQAGS